ncbi:alpha/beta hydrolase [Kineosporia babensis]|uniref:Alpha/beta hydrolase n=1 Tax=Kineosporia babensis TaxID=499548 RepID=A0A9X1NK25_9ACTN|nr:alpha/beta hydrolase [Kineosporia babensis]
MNSGERAGETGTRRGKSRIWRRVGLGVGAVIAVLVVLVGLLYVWPLGSDRLQNAEPQALSFEEARAAGTAAVEQDTANGEVLEECRSVLRVHPEKTAKSVLMLHGYTACPKDFVALADVFYERGYNVYVPREGHHGLTDVDEASQVSADELGDYADDAMNVVAGLGEEAGVIGMSGGGVLGTWLAEYRTDAVSRLLLLSPFYQPAASQAPPYLLRPLTVLYGNRVLPDRKVGDTNFTLSGLGQYLRIMRNLREDPVNDKLAGIAVAYSAKDPYIDLDAATAVPGQIAEANDLKVAEHEFPAELNLPHNLANPDSLGEQAEQIHQLYLELYEG